jgi:hypothetical protein
MFLASLAPLGVLSSGAESVGVLVLLVRSPGQMFAYMVSVALQRFACMVAIFRDKYLEIGQSTRECNREINRINVKGCREFPMNA